MKTKDDRTAAQRLSHQWLITATDRYMSGWGGARGGLSKCAWACDSREAANACHAWVSARSEMKYVRIRPPYGTPWRPRAAHVHIYVWGGRP